MRRQNLEYPNALLRFELAATAGEGGSFFACCHRSADSFPWDYGWDRDTSRPWAVSRHSAPSGRERILTLRHSRRFRCQAFASARWSQAGAQHLCFADGALAPEPLTQGNHVSGYHAQALPTRRLAHSERGRRSRCTVSWLTTNHAEHTPQGVHYGARHRRASPTSDRDAAIRFSLVLRRSSVNQPYGKRTPECLAVVIENRSGVQ